MQSMDDQGGRVQASPIANRTPTGPNRERKGRGAKKEGGNRVAQTEKEGASGMGTWGRADAWPAHANLAHAESEGNPRGV